MTALLPLPVLERVRLQADYFLLLDRSEAFEGFRKIELIDGDMYGMNAQHLPHARIKDEIYFQLRTVLTATGSHLAAVTEASLKLDAYNVPEPDLILTSDLHAQGVAKREYVALVVEVSDTTLSHDLGRKMEAYAAAELAEYWVVDVAGRIIHQMWAPSGETYEDRRMIPFGNPITAATLPGLTIETTGL